MFCMHIRLGGKTWTRWDATGFGLRIMDNYFKLTNEYNTSKIKHKIIDLYDKQNNPTGTKVNITIPLNFNYNLKKTMST